MERNPTQEEWEKIVNQLVPLRKTCLNCRKELTGKQRKFCSTKCTMGYYYDQTEYYRAHKKIEEKSCVICSVKFMPKTRNQKYCKTCKPKYKSRVTSEKTLKENRKKFYSSGDIFILDMENWQWRLMNESERETAKLNVSQSFAENVVSLESNPRQGDVSASLNPHQQVNLKIKDDIN